ncbi:MAG: excinuclease ABC subunit UvrA [Thermodesulfobacteriota bacterium]
MEIIQIKGARHHNLKDISIDLPRNQLVVVCGPSGSGKSTLAFDIVYAEGQRRYVESLSAYARQFLPQMDKPKVESIQGLSPAISLEQQTIAKNPRSTVGTVTEIYDFLRVFFARLGTPFCPNCRLPVQAQTQDQIIERILEIKEGTKFMLLAPITENKKGAHKELLKRFKAQGFVRVRIDGEIFSLESIPALNPKKKHNIDLVIDRLIIKEKIRKRLADSVELALSLGDEKLKIKIVDGEEFFLSTAAVCPECNLSMPRPEPQLFSFNSPQGACPYCSGIGSVEYFDPRLIAPNKGLSLEQGAIIPLKKKGTLQKFLPRLKPLAQKYNFELDTPLREFSSTAHDALFYGDGELAWEGIVHILKQGFEIGFAWRDELSRFRQSRPCPECKGARLKPEALAVYVQDVNIFNFVNMSVDKALNWVSTLKFSGFSSTIAAPLVTELKHRLKFLSRVGLDYLNLARNMATLSGGEAQRIRLAGQLGSGLVGVTYVLDEPSIGLHPRDNHRLLEALSSLRERGNTVLVVEHDQDTILSADHVLELGPGSGALGGEIMYSGDVGGLKNKADSLTGKYLRGELSIPRPKARRKASDFLRLKQVRTNNLKNINCRIPLQCLTVVTGVSGSGKSSLIVDSLYKHLALKQGIRVDDPGLIADIQGTEQIEKVISIDQSPIGRTPRSNPATYTKIFDEIRKIFAGTKEARKRGYKPGRFSFNVRGGRCEACGGDGQIRVEMHFLPDVFVTCEVCKGKRYNRETLEIEYKGKNISRVLDMTVRQASDFFDKYPLLKRRLDILKQVGLEYLKLGQPATTLSGGEAQRIKISRELGKRSLPGAIYILDEPTTGLHMHEVGKLIQVLNQLVDKGATVVVIEHNLDVVFSADYILDLGPGGGEYGGEIVAEGSPEQIKNNPNSVTGKFLDNY